ncbi:FISUMP domain-containing protein [Fibrobacter sp. UWR3]|uniref:FISUMP domain-containing protein n=1 Tax=Fibrobacter sp. UWR3 TaxID=1896217 RepID=UPI0015B53BF6|nr:FISUMP domain-containing protein [Fibrobacter sp. UWR3]
MSSSSAKETKNSSDSKSSSSVKSGDSSSSNKDKSSSSEKQSSSSSVNQSSSTIFSSSGEYIPFDHSLPLLADSVRSGAYKIYEDSRDGQKYYYLTINGKRKDGTRGSVTIFAQNLNYGVQIDGTENQNDDNKVEKYCYENDWIRCDEYGGLYQWAEAMGLPSECNTKSCANLISNPSNHQGICPNGWRLMTYDDYELIYWSTDKGALGIRSQYTFKGSNYTGFSLVGAGYRCSGCSKGFEGRLGIAGWYYPTEIDKNKKLSTSEEFDRSNVFASVGYSYDNKDDLTPNTARSDSKLWGLSIRCVMANQE